MTIAPDGWRSVQTRAVWQCMTYCAASHPSSRELISFRLIAKHKIRVLNRSSDQAIPRRASPSPSCNDVQSSSTIATMYATLSSCSPDSHMADSWRTRDGPCLPINADCEHAGIAFGSWMSSLLAAITETTRDGITLSRLEEDELLLPPRLRELSFESCSA